MPNLTDEERGAICPDCGCVAFQKDQHASGCPRGDDPTGEKLDELMEREKPITLGHMILPMPGKIAVQVDTKNEFTPGGLFLSVDTVRTIHEARATQGVVVAHGDDDDEDDLESPPPRTKIGDVVLFGKYTGTRITWQPPTPEGEKVKPPREEVIVMYEKDVLAVLLTPEQAKNIKVKT